MVSPVAASVEVACKTLKPIRLMHDRDTMEISLQIEGLFLLVVHEARVIPQNISAAVICLCQWVGDEGKFIYCVISEKGSRLQEQQFANFMRLLQFSRECVIVAWQAHLYMYKKIKGSCGYG